MVLAPTRVRAAALSLCATAWGAMGCRAQPPAPSPPPARSEPSRGGAARGEDGALRPRALTYLQDDYERIFPERVRLARYGEVRYAARDRGDAAGEGDRSEVIDMSEAPVLVVVDQVRDRLRVIAPQDKYRLLLWVGADDLYAVVTEPASLSPDGRGGAGALRLHPGLPVEIEGERSGMTRVRHRDDCVGFSGWVPRSAVGTQFVPIEAPAAAANGVVGTGTVVLDRPGGREVARFTADCEVVDTGPERDGHRPIRYATEWFDLRGWVAVGSGKGASGATAGGGSWGYGLGHLGLWGGRKRLRLSEGTCLYGRRGGSVIGVVTEESDAPLSAPVDGWWQVPIETGWGDLGVWVTAAGGPERLDRDAQPGSAGGRAGQRRGQARGEAGPDPDDPSGEGAEPDRPALRRCR